MRYAPQSGQVGRRAWPMAGYSKPLTFDCRSGTGLKQKYNTSHSVTGHTERFWADQNQTKYRPLCATSQFDLPIHCRARLGRLEFPDRS